MKNLLILALFAGIIACNPKPIAKINGDIQNKEADVIIISNQLLKSNDTLKIVDNTFSVTLKVEQPGIYDFQHGNYGFQMYLKPGTEMQIDLDIANLKEGDYSKIAISGKGIDETKLMMKVSALNAGVMSGLRNMLALPSDSFETAINKYKQELTATIDSFKATGKESKHFLDRINTMASIQMSEKYMYYTMYHPRFAPNDSTPIPSAFFEAGNDIALDNEQFFNEMNTYKYFVLQKHDSQIAEILKKEGIEQNSVAEANKHLDLIANLDATQSVKDELGNQLISGYTYVTDEVKDVYKNRYAEIIKNQEYISEFESTLKKLEALQPGNMAPTFAYEDINGDTVTSDQLKGKVIYIDVWATWCGPCMGEIPHLKKLDTELHDMEIAFVSISIDGDKEAWKKMVVNKELQGYQLFAEGEWQSDIIKDYAIQGIPRFILIDKEGKLVNANANRPSSEEIIKKQLIDLAKS